MHKEKYINHSLSYIIINGVRLGNGSFQESVSGFKLSESFQKE